MVQRRLVTAVIIAGVAAVVAGVVVAGFYSARKTMR
jgi:hypothetical protein